MLGNDPQLSELYDAWYGYKCETVRTYTDTMPDKIPIEDNEEFKSIRNAVVSAVRDIHTPPEQPDYAVDHDYSKLKEHADDFDYLYRYANAYDDPIGYYRLGRYYLEKTDDMENAEWWLRMAADEGNSLSAYLIYKAYRDGKFTEGFAKMSDAVIAKRCFGTNNGTPEPWYIIMADLANKGESFAQITEKVHTEWGVSLESCWTHAIRIFRGCLNTRNKHNFAREADRSYLEGYIRAIELAKENSLLVDFAKFDEDIMAKISNLIGDPRKHIKLPLLDIANKIVSSL